MSHEVQDFIKNVPRVLRHKIMIPSRHMQENDGHNYLKNGQNRTLVHYGTSESLA